MTSLSTPEDVVRTVEKPNGTGEYFDANDLAIMVAFMKACKAAGADAIGQGNKYMGDTGIHIDIALTGQSAGNLTKISSSAFWGGKSAKRSLAPAYLADIMTA